MKKVLQVIRDRSKWDQELPSGQGRGVAILEAYNTVVAAVVEVAVDQSYKQL